MAKPTLKQKLLASKMLVNVGSVGKAMLEVGYSKSMAKNPAKVTESKGFQELMVKYLPESLVLKTHKNLLVASGLNCFTFGLSISDDSIKKVIKKIKGSKFISIQPNKKNKKVYFTAPDFHSQKDGVDMAYKLGGKYGAEKLDINSQKLEDALNRMAEIVPKSL